MSSFEILSPFDSTWPKLDTPVSQAPSPNTGSVHELTLREPQKCKISIRHELTYVLYLYNTAVFNSFVF
jgi:hypothetical protein